MTGKQQRFVDEYLVDGNATKAYKNAGYTPKNDATARANAARLLTKANILAAVEAGRSQQQERTQITADRIIQEQIAIALLDPAEIIDFSGETPQLRPANEITERARRAIASIKTKRYTEGQGDSAREVEITDIRFWSKPEELSRLEDRFCKLIPKEVKHSGRVDSDVTMRPVVIYVPVNTPPIDEVTGLFQRQALNGPPDGTTPNGEGA